MAAALSLNVVFVSAQREAPGRSLARGRGGGGGAAPRKQAAAVGSGHDASGGNGGASPGVASHTYAPPFPPMPSTRPAGQPRPHHGGQDGYKRFQQQLWEARQRGGPLHALTRSNISRGVVMAPQQLENQIKLADEQMLLHTPVWLAWDTPYRLQVLLHDRGLVRSRWPRACDAPLPSLLLMCGVRCVSRGVYT
jgi:hypothetical protein